MFQKMRKTCLCCNLSVNTASQIIAVVDMILGSWILGILLLGVIHGLASKWILWLLVAGSIFQVLMGGFLYYAMKKKNIFMCRCWQLVTVATCLITVPYVLRIHHVLVVGEYIQALQDDRRLRIRVSSCPNFPTPITQYETIFQNLAPRASFSVPHSQLTVPIVTRTRHSAPDLYDRCSSPLSVPSEGYCSPLPPPYSVTVEMCSRNFRD